MNEGQIEQARQQVVEGLFQDKKDFRLIMWGAIVCTMRGDIKSAEDFLEEAGKNFYINKEKEQQEEIDHLKIQIEKIRPIYKKTDRMTQKEKALLLKKRGVRH